MLKNFILFLIIFISLSDCSSVDPDKCLSWGPGLRPDNIVMPARYFFIQLVDNNGHNLTAPPEGILDVHIGSADKTQRCRVWSNILDRNDGSYIIRYKVYEVCSRMIIDLRYENFPIVGFPLVIKNPVMSDECNCPKDMNKWLGDMQCPERYVQIDNDLKHFESVDMDALRKPITLKFNKPNSISMCHYVILNNEIHRVCHGKYVGFRLFMDAVLLSLARKVKLPDIEFFVNLGDWPLEKKGPDPLPVFSWCGSDDTADIVMPTYDITEATLECMGRVQLDMLSVQGNAGPSWSDKQPVAFWRGRDSRHERLQLIKIARDNPNLFNASLTNFFFFRDKEEEFGPKQPHVSFFHFFEYKYQICIDGSVAAYRMPYLLAGGGMVLKQDSPYYEHFYHRLVPYEHYVPVNRNLSNIVEQVLWAKSHDDEARKIARNGALFARENLMPKDVFCYHAVLFQEWKKRLESSVNVIPMMEHVVQKEASHPCDCEHRHDEL